MANNALYFPYIEPPRDEWTLRTILYWDRVDSIMPHGVSLRDSTKALIDQGLLAPVDWYEASAATHAFQDGFVAHIHRLGASPRARVWANFRSLPGQRIHTLKMPDSVKTALRDTGLGIEVSDLWWRVRADVAGAYMSAMAWELARRRGDLDLVSNRLESSSGFRLTAAAEIPDELMKSMPARKAVLRQLLEDLFPVPTKWPSPIAIHQFKAEHSEPLKQFRGHVDRQVIDVMRSFGRPEFAEYFSAVRADLLQQRRGIEIALETSKLEFARKVIAPAAVSVAAFAFSGDYRLAVAVPVIWTLVDGFVSNRVLPREKVAAAAQNPMIYAALFQSRFSEQ